MSLAPPDRREAPYTDAGRALRGWRSHLEHTLRTVATHVECTVSRVSDCERGFLRHTPEECRRLDDLYGQPEGSTLALYGGEVSDG